MFECLTFENNDTVVVVVCVCLCGVSLIQAEPDEFSYAPLGVWIKEALYQTSILTLFFQFPRLYIIWSCDLYPCFWNLY